MPGWKGQFPLPTLANSQSLSYLLSYQHLTQLITWLLGSHPILIVLFTWYIFILSLSLSCFQNALFIKHNLHVVKYINLKCTVQLVLMSAYTNVTHTSSKTYNIPILILFYGGSSSASSWALGAGIPKGSVLGPLRLLLFFINTVSQSLFFKYHRDLHCPVQ